MVPCAYGHVLRKEDDDWVKKCMEYEVDGSRPRRRPKRTWKEVVREDCQARKLNKEDAMDRCRWRKVIKEVRWPGWVWASECFFWYRPTWVVPDKRRLNCCCCYSGGCSTCIVTLLQYYFAVELSARHENGYQTSGVKLAPSSSVFVSLLSQFMSVSTVDLYSAQSQSL